MCGLTGIISKNRIEPAVIRAMTDTLVHRGPDGEGYLFSETPGPGRNLPGVATTKSPVPLAFGHRRLAIVDLSPLGHQPMSYLDRYWIVYNGEIYNHIELREELEAEGYRFRSRTDTEVIMAAYDAWDVACLERFNGMWAFVIYDSTKNEIFISRDRFGIKPLYFYQDDDNFVFASEIKALLVHPAVPKMPNREYCRTFLKKGAMEYLRETAFERIFRFQPAGYIRCRIDDIFIPFKETIFWRIQPNLSEEKFDKSKADHYARRYFELLDDAVRLRLRADVKIGSALSGGLDSSSVVFLVNHNLRRAGIVEHQETFSSVYRKRGTEYCDESAFIDEMAGFLDVVSHKIEPKVEDILKEHRKFTYYLDTPASNTLMSSWHTYKLIHQLKVKVTLDGQGADEQLADYLGYFVYYFASNSLPRMILESFNSLKIPGAFRFVTIGVLLNFARQILGEKNFRFLMEKAGKDFSYHALNKELIEDISHELVTLFHYADRGSMAFSIESRMPFMDYRLVEFLASVPVCYKIHDGWTKFIARKAFNGLLPEKVCWRRDKMGWPIPEEYWFRGPLREHFIATLRNARFLPSFGVQLFNGKEEEIFRKYPFDFLVRCYVLETWHDVFWMNGMKTG